MQNGVGKWNTLVYTRCMASRLAGRPTRTTDLSKLTFGVKKGQLSPRLSADEDARLQQLLRHLNTNFSRLIEMVILMFLEDATKESRLVNCVKSFRQFTAPKPTIIQRNVRVAPVALTRFMTALRTHVPDAKDTSAVRWALNHYAEALFNRTAPPAPTLETAHATSQQPKIEPLGE